MKVTWRTCHLPLTARLAGVPIVVEMFYGTLFADYSRPWVSRLLVWEARRLARLMDAVIAVSHAAVDEIIRLQVASRQRTRHPARPAAGAVARPQAHGRHPPRELGLGADVPLVGAVGWLVAIKGWRLRQGLLLRTALGGQVPFIGWRRNVERIYPDLDVVMLTCLHEGPPVSLIVAMATGRAVVATRASGVPDVLQDGVTGLLVPLRYPGAPAQAAVRLLHDPEARRGAPRGSP